MKNSKLSKRENVFLIGFFVILIGSILFRAIFYWDEFITFLYEKPILTISIIVGMVLFVIIQGKMKSRC